MQSFNKINITEVTNSMTKSFEDLKVEMENNGVEVREKFNTDYANLYLLTTSRDIEDPMTELQMQCNGLVFDKETNNLIVACQNKLHDISLEELQTITSTTQTQRFEYCEDGTVIRLYFYKNEWRTATTRCIDAKDSFWSSQKTFDEMFWEVFDKKYLTSLDPNSTYVFVLLHSDNRIVVKHNTNILVYISKIHNVTLMEDYTNIFSGDLSIRRPKQIPYFDINEFEKYYLPFKRGIIVKVYNEVNNTWTMYKIDFEKYQAIKTLRGNVPNIRMRYLELLNDSAALEALQQNYPEHSFLFAVIKHSLARVCKEIHSLYIESHVKHNTQVDDTHMYFRTLRQLHAQYKLTNTPITLDDVQSKVFSLNKHVLKHFLCWVN
jgi:hypothetical protein